jgi:hypothetical protein
MREAVMQQVKQEYKTGAAGRRTLTQVGRDSSIQRIAIGEHFNMVHKARHS